MKKGFSHNQPERFDRPLAASHAEPYRSRTKRPEPTVCPRCGLEFDDGHWQALHRPEQAHEHVCPACHAGNDRFPSGYATLQGPFVAAHREQFVKLAHTAEAAGKRPHPLQRIIGTEEDGDKITFTTTDVHVARRIGEAIHHACQGKLDTSYGPGDTTVRATWSR
jgi:hypothetical protein